MSQNGQPVAIGVDLCDMRRIEALLTGFKERFLQRVYTQGERQKFQKKPYRAGIGYLAKRWAAKEAVSKVLGTGFRQGVHPQTIEVCNKPSGAPYVRLYGAAQERLRRLTKKNNMSEILITMTDEPPYALCEICLVCS